MAILAPMLEEEKKQMELLRVKHFGLARLTVSIEDDKARVDALTTKLEALEQKGGANVI